MRRTVFSIPPEQRERIRQGILELEREGERASVRLIRERVGGSTDVIAFLVRAVAAGFISPEEPWDGRVAPLDLREAIRAATTHDDHVRIHQEVAARVACGDMKPQIAKSIQDSMTAARLSAKAALEASPPVHGEDSVQLVDRATFLISRVVNRIASPSILEEVQAFVYDAGRRDLDEFPNPTIDEVSHLRGEGLPS